MNRLLDILTSESLSLVIEKDEKIYRYTNRGVSDLYDIVCSDKSLLKDASLADKIVGKGAAVLMAIGGVKSLVTTTISSSALQLLEANGVEVGYSQEVSHIINRAETDWCPIEKLCKDCDDLDQLFVKIDSFIKQMRNA